MEVANGVEMLEIKIATPSHSLTINPTLISDQETAILIDTGFPGLYEQIGSAMRGVEK